MKISGGTADLQPMTASGTYQGMSTRSAPVSKGPMNTNKGHHPGVTRISKHPMKSLTSRKSQQGKGGC